MNTPTALKGWRAQRHAARLGWCPACKEHSVTVKVWEGKDGALTRSWICLNKGHGLIEAQQLKQEHSMKGG
jgi:hypothetical protein